MGSGGSGLQRPARVAEKSAPIGAAPGAQAEPGTGYGESEWSPSRQVEFEPLPQPFAQYFLKYTWRDTLCLGVIDCDGGRRPSRNRFWKEDDDYAPPPHATTVARNGGNHPRSRSGTG